MTTAKQTNIILAVANKKDRQQEMKILAELGYPDVFAASDGLQAKKILQTKQNVHLLICNTDLAKMNGLGLLEWMRTKSKKFRHTPFILTTSSPDDFADVALINQIDSTVLATPFNKAELQTHIEKVIKSQPESTTEKKVGEQGSLSKLLFEKGVAPKENQTLPVVTSNTEELDKLQEEITALKLHITKIDQELAAHKQTIDSLFAQGVELLKTEQLFEAAGFFNAELIFNPDNLKALNNLAVIYFEMDMTDKAEETLKSILQIEPDNKLAKENLAELN